MHYLRYSVSFVSLLKQSNIFLFFLITFRENSCTLSCQHKTVVTVLFSFSWVSRNQTEIRWLKVLPECLLPAGGPGLLFLFTLYGDKLIWPSTSDAKLTNNSGCYFAHCFATFYLHLHFFFSSFLDIALP